MAIGVGGTAATSGNQQTGFTLTIPSCAAGDILILGVTNRGATTDPTVVDTDTGGNLWAKAANQNADTNGAGTVWWKRATSATGGKVITVALCTNSASGCVVVYTGASNATTPTGTPVSEANASGNETQAGITVNRDLSYVMFFVMCTSNDSLNPNTYTATSPATLTERAEGVSTGGQDCSCSQVAQEKTAAGATGAISWLQTDGTGASIAFELYVKAGPLTAAGGAFTYTGTAATLKRGLRLSADSGTFLLSGTAADLRKGYPLSAGSGTFLLSGTAATLLVGREVAADSGTFLMSGTAASLEVGRLVSADSGTFLMSGTAASLEVGREVSADSGTFSLSGTAASLEVGREIAADSGTFTYSGTPAGLFAGRKISADSGTFTLTGMAADLIKGGGGNKTLLAGSGTFLLAGMDVTFVIVPVPGGGGGGLPEDFAFSIRNQRVQNHARALAGAILKPGDVFTDDERVAAVHAEAERNRRRILLQQDEDEAMIMLLLSGFE